MSFILVPSVRLFYLWRNAWFEFSVADTFNRAVALLHSFEYPEARAVFESVAQQDPACGMAHWGVAMTHYHPHRL